MKVISLHVYPVKSLGSIEIETAFAGEKGFAMDRRWMVVKPDGKFITQREFPKMSRIAVKIENKSLVFNNQLNSNSFSISCDEIANELEVEVWDDQVLAYEVNTEVSEWFTRQIGETVKLVRMGEASKRNIEQQYSTTGETVSFADSLPYMITNDSSLKMLNQRLGHQVNMNRFRPNIVFNGAGPFEEDNWKKIHIGEVVFKLVKPCSRCKIVNINSETGEMDKNEPLLTLSSFRKFGSGVHFGVNMIAENYGKISVEDTVNVIE